ncbi:MAG TPA: SpoIIE family protein phosphatase [Bacteroidia bacterium]|nr:SpoIIE family protein phosphatase [Bacteroidia bacterium]
MENPENRFYLDQWHQEVRRLMIKSSSASWPLTSLCLAAFIFVEIYHRNQPDYITPFYFLFLGCSVLVMSAHLLRKKIKYPYIINAFGTSILVPIVTTIAACITVSENVFTYFLMGSVVIVVRGLLYCQKVKTLAIIAVCSHVLIFTTVLLVRKEPYLSLPNILSTNIIQLFLVMFSLSGTASRYKLTRDNFLNSLRLADVNKTIAEKNKDITDSINYARRIQRSLLPQQHFLDSNIGEHCVFYRPKDIVSGDFYWASRLQNGDFAIVVGDSTGHGVPGAIMSMLNIASLNEIQNHTFITSPASVLDHARKRIIEHLDNHENEEGAKDGMDAIVVCIDKEFKKLTYAAANNSLWLVRNGEVDQLKGDKMSVGKDANVRHAFTERTIALQKNDLLFMFTDGYTDQFGGARGKKLMIKRFRETMRNIAHLPLQEMREKLADHFDEWKGEHEQTDDVLVFAMRVN